MVTAQDVMTFARSEPIVTVDLIAKQFDVSEEKAAKVIQILWSKGKLTPFTTSFFTVADGSEVPAYKAGTAKVSDFRRKHYAEELTQYRQLFEGPPTRGLTVSDVLTELGEDPEIHSNRTKAHKILKLLEEDKILICRSSRYGGAYGRPPKIWGITEDDVDFRELDLQDEAETRRKAKKQKSGDEADPWS